MITLSKRSVTRFFIPLIDVLILLFCIFLLMPFVSAPAKLDDDKPESKAALAESLPTDVKELQKRLIAASKERDEAVKRLDRYQKVSGERHVIQLEIDPKSGRLIWYSPSRQEIASQEHAEKVIAHEKKLAGEKDIFFTIQYPRQASGHPTDTDLSSYRDWFRNVPHGFEIPRPGP